MSRALGISDKKKDNKIESDQLIMNQIRQRQNKDYLPTMQLDRTVEFKPYSDISEVLPMSPNKNAPPSIVPSNKNKFENEQPDNNSNHYLQMRY